MKTSVGVLAIQVVERTSEEDISEADARRAGSAGRDALLEELSRREGELYRIALAYAGEDPRIELRENDNISEAEFGEISARLQRLDSASPSGDWTRQVLMALNACPKAPAHEIAARTGFEKDQLKRNVRKLKNLGLTVSHNPGYTLSPRGEAVFRRLTRED